MFSHVNVGVRDLALSGLFYDAVLRPLGLIQRPIQPDGGPGALCWHRPGHALPRFYATLPFDCGAPSAGNGTMVAFLAPSPEAVSAAHAAGLAHGGTDEGAPGPRPRYGDGYVGAYLRDPDGNKIHLVHRPESAEAD